MQRKTYLKILYGIVILCLLIKLLIVLLAEPRVREKIQAAFNEKSKDYYVEIDKVHILLIAAGIKLDSITIFSKQKNKGIPVLEGKIASIKFEGIHILKALFTKDIVIRDITISNSNLKGKIPFPKKAKLPIILPLDIRIGKILFNNMELSVENTSTPKSYSLNKGDLKVYNLHFIKQDTLSIGIINQFDFEAEKIKSVSADSMFTISARNIAYSTTSNTLTANNFSLQPNYKDYDFTSRYKYQTDRIEAGFSNIYIQNFNAADYFKSQRLISSYIEIGKIEMKVFRDKRKEFRHINKPALQDRMYSFPGFIQLDSIAILNGDITYIEHAEKANEPGYITFAKINAKFYKITNDSSYRKENAYSEFKCNALLMGKGKLTIRLKSRIFDSQNTFSMNGSLSDMDINEMNPYMDKNAFIYATSGKLVAMDFNFTANNTKATGKITMLYNGLEITIKNKRTDDTTAFKERFISAIANKKILNSNPMPGKEVREGIIEYERDPERFILSYCVKSIMSGIKSSIIKSPKNK